MIPRLLFVTQWFQPEPTIVPDQIAHALARTGFEVRVLTGIPNYPTGRVGSGYRAWRGVREHVEGISVHRTPLYPSHDQSAVRRVLNYLSWAATATVFGLGDFRRSDIALVYGSPITAAIPAMIANRLGRVPFVLIVQDLWPDSVFSTGFLRTGLASRIARAILDRLCRATYRIASHIVVISPGMAAVLESRGVPRRKITVIYNWYSSASEHPGVAAEPLRDRIGAAPEDFVLMYAGNHGPAQALHHVVDAVDIIGREHRPWHLVFVGDGVTKRALEEQAEQTSGSVHFIAPQSGATIRRWMREADAQLVSLANEPLFAVTLPSKLQSALAAGSPVLLIGAGDAVDLVTSARCGVAAHAGDPQDIAHAIEELMGKSASELDLMGARGVARYQLEMSEEIGSNRYGEILRKELGVKTNG